MIEYFSHVLLPEVTSADPYLYYNEEVSKLSWLFLMDVPSVLYLACRLA